MPTIKEILQNTKLAPLKKLGQNFLVYPETAARIVDLARVKQEDTVLELGVGLGTLTEPLARRANKVIGLEIDRGIIHWHQQKKQLASNVSLRHQDLLTADFQELAEECGHPLKIVTNLPYSISNPLLFKLLDNKESIEWAAVMLQKEVAMRLLAQPKSKEYGILSVLFAANARVINLLDVGPGQFYPRPKVDSVVVKIIFQPVPERSQALPPHRPEFLRQIVRAGFQQRRKTLVNSLAAAPMLSFNKDQIRNAMAKAGIKSKARAEDLRVENFVDLCRLLDH